MAANAMAADASTTPTQAKRVSGPSGFEVDGADGTDGGRAVAIAGGAVAAAGAAVSAATQAGADRTCAPVRTGRAMNLSSTRPPIRGMGRERAGPYVLGEVLSLGRSRAPSPV